MASRTRPRLLTLGGRRSVAGRPHLSVIHIPSTTPPPQPTTPSSHPLRPRTPPTLSLVSRRLPATLSLFRAAGLIRDSRAPERLQFNHSHFLKMPQPIHTFNIVPKLPPALEPLREIVYNLWWSWEPAARRLFRNLDVDLWNQTNHNPLRMLQFCARRVWKPPRRTKASPANSPASTPSSAPTSTARTLTDASPPAPPGPRATATT